MARKSVAIENYPGFEEISGLELIKNFEKHLRKQKIDIERDSAIAVKKIGDKFLVKTESKQKFESKAIIIASGADPRPLEAKGEKKFIGKGVSYCTTCDAPIFADKTVAVIGGGNSGFEAALTLARYAKKVFILEFNQKVGADEENQQQAEKTGKIDIITNAAVKEIQGKNFVESIIYQDRPGQKFNNLLVQGVFVEIGSQPATSFVKDLVDFNEKDEIKINPKTCETKTPGLFAAGDATDVFLKQIVVASGEGAKAAISAYYYVKRKD